LLICGNAIAQETRESDITRKQVAKAKTLAPYKPNKVENLIVELQQWGLVGVPRGLYPILFGSAFPSGGSAFGGGYRKMFADTGAFDVHGAITPTSTKVLASSLRLPRFAEDRLDSILILKYQDAPEVAFFGIGNDSSDENETNYAFTPSSVRLAETLDVSNFIRVGGEIAYEKYDTAVGESTRVPPIEEEFSPDEVPGLGLDSKYFVGSAFFQFDWRPSPGYATSGGSYRLDWSNYSQQDGDGFNFNRLDVELVQHVPVLRANQIFSFRGLASFTDVEEGQQVPFYLLPKLGGGKDLRGFHDFRFMDRHLMLLAAEYRWTPSKFMDMAVFYEVGKVAPETSDLNFEDLHESYGIGARFHTPYQTALRIEFAISKESKRIIFSGGPSF
jgi:outer membrane protein assembly factor BamA